MKRIVSVSIGSSSRDKKVETELLGEKYIIERIGTDGDFKKAIETIKSLDGKIDAFGMGGIDIYLTGAGKRYIIREAIPIRDAARKTPLVDGTGLKNTLEKKAVLYLRDNNILDLKNKKVLVTCAVDRFRMAQGFEECGSIVSIGDLAFALGIPKLIKSMKAFKILSDIAVPFMCKLPFKMLYPTGDKQKDNNTGKYADFYNEADIIAGDYHYIKKYMPESIKGKIIVTNTVTAEDVAMLKDRGAAMLVTTTPDLDGRSFGTNVIEAVLVAASGKKPEDISEEEYYRLIEKLDIKPRIEYLN